ncbi:hypothetical protein Mrose_02533 [Calidithermus roseus]|uniref:Uncharacterized protein n=1 Tax=Calidithermus roseus TaxID=1644118 RepID=A0A399EL19_9DEIN|nr:hypothetical protein Mrose_02533 [Calidithermus roseus]
MVPLLENLVSLVSPGMVFLVQMHITDIILSMVTVMVKTV